MKRQQLLLNTFIVSTLMMSQLVPTAVVATTIPSAEKTTSSSAHTLKTLSSDQIVSTSETKEPETILPEVEEVTVEKQYDDRKLGSEEQVNSVHPTVHLTEKKKTSNVKVTGTIVAGTEENKKTKITKLVLQSKVAGQEWQDREEVDELNDSFLQEKEQAVTFELEDPKDQEAYRLVTEYEVTTYSEGQLLKKENHKASFSIEALEEEPAHSSEEESASTEITEESTTESSKKGTDSNSTEGSISESTEDSSNSSNESSSTSTEDEQSENNSTTSSDESNSAQDKPELKQDTSSSLDSINRDNRIPKSSNAESNTGRSKYSISPFAGTGEGYWQIRQYNTHPTVSSYVSGIRKNEFKIDIGWYGKSEETESGWSSNPKSIGIHVSKSKLPKNTNVNIDPNSMTESNGYYSMNITNIGESNTIDACLEGNKTIKNLTPGTKYYLYVIYKYNDNYGWQYYGGVSEDKEKHYTNSTPTAYLNYGYEITMDAAAPLKEISKPIIDQTTAKVTSDTTAEIKLKQGSYKGDISPTAADGVVDVKKPNGTWSTSKNNLKHDVTTDGKYATDTTTGTTFGQLYPGTQYYAKVKLKNYAKDWLPDKPINYPISDKFFTPIAAKRPDEAANITTTTCTFRVHYGATKGTADGAHPNGTADYGIQVRKKKADGTWDSWKDVTTQSTGIKFSNAVTNRDHNSPNVTFKLEGLAANTEYEIKCRFNNDSKKWSDYSTARTFKTKGVDLKIKTPTFDNSEASVTGATNASVHMKQGTYFGNSYSSVQDGDCVRVREHGETDWPVKIKNLPHSITYYSGGTESTSPPEPSGTYGQASGTTISGLKAGTNYNVQVVLINYNNTPVWTVADAGEYSYAKTVTTPVFARTVAPQDIDLTTPTTYGDATATIRAHYDATTANPYNNWTGIEVKFSTTSASAGFWDVTTTGNHAKGEEISVDTTSPTKKVTFKVSHLLANKKYWVKYRLKNADGTWSNEVTTDFKTKGIPLKIEDPIIDYDKVSSTVDGSTIHVNRGNFTGHTYFEENAWERFLIRKKGETTWTGGVTREPVPERENEVPSLTHTVTYPMTGRDNNPPEGTYGGINGETIKQVKRGTSLENLKAGSIYDVRLVLRPADGGDYTWNPNNVAVSTPVFARKPNPPEDNALTDTTAAIRAYYDATKGEINGAHPSGFEDYDVQIKEAGGTWSDSLPRIRDDLGEAPPTDRITLTEVRTNSNPSDSGPNIQFKLNGLKSRTTYRVRYRLNNKDIGGEKVNWSNYSEPREFTTNATPITWVPQPVFQAKDSTSSILKKDGHFIGDADRANLAVRTSKVDGAISNHPEDWDQLPTYEGIPLNNEEKTYSTNEGYTFGNLNPGTHYQGRVTLKSFIPDPENPPHMTWVSSHEFANPRYSWVDFYTPNKVSDDSISRVNKPVPLGRLDASISFRGNYEVSEYPSFEGQAHPKTSGVSDGINEQGVQVEIKAQYANEDPTYSDWVSLSSQATTNSRAYVRSLNLNQSMDEHSIDFDIAGLKERTRYQIRYRVKNESDVWSNWSNNDFSEITNQRAFGLYVSHAPDFNFGMRVVENHPQEINLYNHSQQAPFNMEIENIGMSANWTFTAKLETLKEVETDNPLSTNASVSIGKHLTRASDGVDVSQEFQGSLDPSEHNTVNLPQDQSITLWQSPSVVSGQGSFIQTIDPSSVKLNLPAGAGERDKRYRGIITWTMDVVME